MTRFSNLEFGGEFEEHEQTSGIVKDEAYYLAEAEAAFCEAEFEKALRLYARVLEQNCENTGAWTGQVRSLIELGELREATLWANKALERFSRDPELLAAKAVALGRSGDLKAALAFSDASIEERGDTPYVWLARGDVLLARREKRAAYCFDKALLLGRYDAFLLWLASRIHYFHEKFSLALTFAQRALTADTSRSVFWLQSGLCQTALGLHGLARGSFEQALELKPACVRSREALTELDEQGAWSWLRKRFRRLFSK